MQDIVNMIVNVGFPIVTTLCLGYYIKTLHDNYRKDIKDLTDKHEKEVDELTKAITDLSYKLDIFDVETEVK